MCFFSVGDVTDDDRNDASLQNHSFSSHDADDDDDDDDDDEYVTKTTNYLQTVADRVMPPTAAKIDGQHHQHQTLSAPRFPMAPLQFPSPHHKLPSSQYFTAVPFPASALHPSAFKSVLPSSDSSKREAETNVTVSESNDDVNTYTDITPPDSPELDPVGDD